MAGRFFALLVGFAAVLLITHPAFADETYTVDGKDSFTVGDRDLRGDVLYRGHETLAFKRNGSALEYTAKAEYERTDQGARSQAHALFVTLLTPSGEQHDQTDEDPDFLTVLNQPFAIVLDAPTMRAVARLTEKVAFDFRSPISGKTLHGFLSNGGTGTVAGVRTLAIVFEAEGDLKGFSPGGLTTALDGRMHVKGTAWYALDTALLRALDTQLTISGKYAGSNDPTTIVIVYRRTIRAVSTAALKEANRAR
jgi:hypothetical protein